MRANNKFGGRRARRVDDASLDELRQLWAESSRPDRMYPLVSHGWGYGFYTGRLPDCRQAVAFWDGPKDVVLLLFDPVGAYLGHEQRRLPALLDPGPGTPPSDEPAHAHLGRELGFASGLIGVRRFREPRWAVSVEPLADCYLRFVRDPAGHTAGSVRDQLDLLGVVREWVQEGRFAFLFHNEFWMGPDGEVECS